MTYSLLNCRKDFTLADVPFDDPAWCDIVQRPRFMEKAHSKFIPIVCYTPKC